MPLDISSDLRRFAVHGLNEAPAARHLIEGLSFVDAALSFVEQFHPAADADDHVAVVVEDCGTGERQCFRIELASGEVAACG